MSRHEMRQNAHTKSSCDGWSCDKRMYDVRHNATPSRAARHSATPSHVTRKMRDTWSQHIEKMVAKDMKTDYGQLDN